MHIIIIILVIVFKKLEIEMAKDVAGNEDARGMLKHPFFPLLISNALREILKFSQLLYPTINKFKVLPTANYLLLLMQVFFYFLPVAPGFCQHFLQSS